MESQRRQGLRFARTLEPELLVLAVARGTHQRRDREAAGPTPLQLRKAAPDLVVEWTFHMTRDDGVPSVQY
jgi:hypothetical protein